jgi:FtsZ-interacting cell division protein ZipA
MDTNSILILIGVVAVAGVLIWRNRQASGKADPNSGGNKGYNAPKSKE